jgi:hypothetical protein
MKRIALVCVLCIGLIGCGNAPINNDEEDKTGVSIGEQEIVEIEEPLVEEALGNQTNLIIITGDMLNIRDGHTSIDSNKLGVVLQESVYTILDEAVDEEERIWFEIKYDTNLTGWIAGWFTAPYDNPNNYILTSDQWRDYNIIQKEINNNGWFKDVLAKNKLDRNLVYDFDNDGNIDIIDFEMIIGESQSGVKGINQSIINYEDQKLVFDYVDNGEYAWGITEFGVVDVDSSDQTVEFFIKEGDLADRVIYSFYRIDQGELVQVTTMRGEILGAYGDGKLYYWGGQLIEPYYKQDLNPDMALSYYDIDQLEYVNTDQIIGKSFTNSQQMILFEAKDDVLDGPAMEFGSMLEMTKDTRVALLEVGNLLTVMDIDHNTLRARVSTESGYEGWIGGFHMVWD